MRETYRRTAKAALALLRQEGDALDAAIWVKSNDNLGCKSGIKSENFMRSVLPQASPTGGPAMPGIFQPGMTEFVPMAQQLAAMSPAFGTSLLLMVFCHLRLKF